MRLVDRFWEKRQAQLSFADVAAQATPIIDDIMRNLEAGSIRLSDPGATVGVYHSISQNGLYVAPMSEELSPHEFLRFNRIGIGHWDSVDYVNEFQNRPEEAARVMNYYLNLIKEVYQTGIALLNPDALRIAQDQLNESGELSEDVRAMIFTDG